MKLTREILGPYWDSASNLKLCLTTLQDISAEDPNCRLLIGYPRMYDHGEDFDAAINIHSSGHIWIAGDIEVNGKVTAKSFAQANGEKIGYVADYFINASGDVVSEGDVVVTSNNEISHYWATLSKIPIPEIDLTIQAYDSRVCGVVARIVTEADLPYVKLLDEDQPKARSLAYANKQTEDKQSSKNPLKHYAARTGEALDNSEVKNQQMGMMVTLGAFAYCKVDADIAPIKAGDLLTTSPTRGHAQKVLVREEAVGAIVGKALGSLDKGKGKIPILVMLQ